MTAKEILLLADSGPVRISFTLVSRASSAAATRRAREPASPSLTAVAGSPVQALDRPERVR